MAHKNSTGKSWASKLPEKQTGNKNSWRFRSITTPGHSFSIFQFIAEMVVLQRFGIAVPPYFWYKRTNCPKMRQVFQSVQSQLAAMIRRNKAVTALQLLSVVCEKFPPLPPKKIVEVQQEPVQASEQPLIELKAETVGNTMKEIMKRIS